MNKNLQYESRRHTGELAVITGGILLAFTLAGCAHIISKETFREVDTGITFEALSRDPGSYKGKTVLLGGVIVKTENRKDGTLLELYQTGLNSYGEPINTDLSEGRFLAMDKRFLDSEIYRAGRKVTVAGVVNGIEVIKLGEIDYTCPYILIKEIHLWKEDPSLKYDPYYRNFRDPFLEWRYPWNRWHYPYWPYTWYYQDMYYRHDTLKSLPKDKVYIIDKDNAKESGGN